MEGYKVRYNGKTFPLPSGSVEDALGTVFEQNGFPGNDGGNNGDPITLIAPNGDKLSITPTSVESGKADQWETNEAAKLVHGGRRTARKAA